MYLMNPSRKVLTKSLGREGKTWSVIGYTPKIQADQSDLFNQLKANLAAGYIFICIKCVTCEMVLVL